MDAGRSLVLCPRVPGCPGPRVERAAGEETEAFLPCTGRLHRLARSLARTWGCPSLTGNLLIRYNPRMRSRLGAAHLDENRVDLNLRLLMRHPGQVVPTLIHELAHLAVERLHPGRKPPPHGKAWAALMAAAGQEPSATHRLPVDGLARRRRRRRELRAAWHFLEIQVSSLAARRGGSRASRKP